MAASTTEVQGGKGPQSATAAPRAPRENGLSQQIPLPARYFLAKPDGGGAAPAFERECASEAEAIAEAFKAGITYYSIVEYRALVDCSGKQPVFKKEVVKRNP